MGMKNKISISAPGRICLFGEHQDYLNLPVIPSAISLRINIHAAVTDDSTIKIDLPDINSTEKINLNEEIIYNEERDYLKSSINVLKKKNYEFSKGLDVTVRGNIPINSGTSSSTALIVAWVKLLTKLNGINLPAKEIAKLAHKAEVLEFNEPGGKMDHYSTAIGGVMFLDFTPKTQVEKLNSKLGKFVLGDSGESKDTKAVLSRVKTPIQYIINKIKLRERDFSLRNIEIEELDKYHRKFTTDEFNLLAATKKNYDITMKAKKLLTQSDIISNKEIGSLLTQEHKILREDLKISTAKIDKMIENSLNAGAYGAKINGSGGGGCMFAYAPDNPEEVAESIRKLGCKAYIIEPDEGVKIDKDNYSSIAI